jgi:hypothetical protein
MYHTQGDSNNHFNNARGGDSNISHSRSTAQIPVIMYHIFHETCPVAYLNSKLIITYQIL